VNIKNNTFYNNNKFENDNNNNKRQKIMIIDDDIYIANLFKIFLECNGYTVDSYTNPIDALNNYRKQSYNLVILDLKMPKMDGITLYQKIKEIDEQVIICLTTANKNIIYDLQKGITDIEKIVIYKPVLLKDLKNKIESVLVNDKYLDPIMRKSE
jgi:DNA-binding response OmpR family regulator